MSLIKSKKRIADHGEVFTPPWLVEAMLDLVKGEQMPFPRITAPPRTHENDAVPIDITTGIGPDLMQGARDAVSGMIDHLCREQGISAMDAYMLCSVAGDLRISQVVDAPNWTVSFHMPRGIFG